MCCPATPLGTASAGHARARGERSGRARSATGDLHRGEGTGQRSSLPGSATNGADNWLANACVSQLYAAVQAALATIWLCVAIGTALGLSERLVSRATDPIRAFAIVSAGLVAIVVLLPHAVESEGLWGLVAGAAAFAAIPVVERLGAGLFRGLPTQTVRREVGFVGLLLHRFADGVAMRVEGHGADVLFALGAHEIPIVALVTLAYLDRGLGPALFRVVLLGASSTLGCTAVDVLPGALGSLHGYADALAAGILLHIVVHELWEPAPAPRTHGLDVLGAALAGLVLWVPSGGEPSHGAVGGAVLDWLLLTAPAAALGLVTSGIIAALGSPGQVARRREGSLFAAAADAQPENVAISFALLGWRLAALRLAGAGAVALVLAVARRRTPARAPQDDPHPDQPPPAARFVARWWDAVRARSAGLVVWLLLGAVVAAYLETFMPEGLLAAPRSWPALAAGAALVFVARISPAAATTIAAAMISNGLSPSVALAGLWLGLATSSHALAAFQRSFGEARARRVASALVLAALVVCAAVDIPRPDALASRAHGYAWPFLAAIALIGAAAMARATVRGWLASGLGMQHGDAPRHTHSSLDLPRASGTGSTRAADTGSV